MDYYTFRKTLKEALQQEMGEEVCLSLQEICKNNGIVSYGISIRPKGEIIAPLVYLDVFYQAYEAGMDFSQVVREVVKQYEKGNVTGISLADFSKYQMVKDQIYFKLINYEKNRDMLKTVPHFPYLDLAVVFYYRLEETELKGATVLIHNSNLELWKITREELLETAWVNTPEKLPYTFQGMGNMIADMLLEEGVTEPEKEEVIEPEKEGDTMYILTNKDKYYGASCLLYPNLLEHIGYLFSGSFYILPSSIHECILVPDSGRHSPEELSHMVQEVNQTQVEPTEVLSDHVYYFDVVHKKLEG